MKKALRISYTYLTDREDDKHRGQYPKIEEAKTPFHYAEEEDD